MLYLLFMNGLIKKILKEESENLERFNRGVDNAMSILNKDYPFIKGWKMYDNSWTYDVDITILCDIDETSRFYNSEVRSIWIKNYNNDDDGFAYPFSPLELSRQISSDEQYQLYKGLKEDLNDIYSYIPDNLKTRNVDGRIKGINMDRFVFI
jgi:hypothetical protein